MRDILFKGKTYEEEWVQGVPFWEGDRCYIIEDLFVCDEYNCTGAVNSMVIPETVGQYTGLYDSTKWEQLTTNEQSEWLKHHNKNEWIGKKIFEGDIVCFGGITGIINYNYGCYCVKTNKPDWKCRNNPAIDIVMNEYTNEIEVIGNIHDNPELLK